MNMPSSSWVIVTTNFTLSSIRWAGADGDAQSDKGALGHGPNRAMGGFGGRRFEAMGWCGEQAQRVKAMAEATE